MYPNTAKKSGLSYFMLMGIIGFLAVLIGFGKTLPVTLRNLKTPQIIYIHAGFAFAWLCLFFIQATLIRLNNFPLHRILGFFGFFIAAGASITMLPAGVFQVQTDLNNGATDTAYSAILGVTTTSMIFLSLVTAAILNRKKSEVHKRLMLLATILVIWPAWFRFRHYFPSVPRPDIWFALVLPNLFIVIAWIWDKYKNGRIHPVLAWVGAFMIAEQTFETIVYDNGIWRAFAKWLFDLLNR